MERRYTALNGEPFTIEGDEPDDRPAAFFLSIHKAGSVLLQKMVRDIATAARRPVLELEPDLFRQGIILGDCPLEALLLLEEDGYVQSGFRSPWLLAHVRKYRTRKKLFLVRDPRDIAVSYYFSMARSHSLPAAGTARDALLQLRDKAGAIDPSTFVLRGHINGIVSNIIAFGDHADRFGDFEVVRYEDVIFDKGVLAAAICRTMGVSLPAETVESIAKEHDIRPDEERPDMHVRQVAPGNYQKYLSPEAQEFLVKRFRRAFNRFNYSVS